MRLFIFPHFPDNKIEGVPWYISHYSPPREFFSLYSAPIYFSTTSRLQAFRGTTHIIPPYFFPFLGQEEKDRLTSHICRDQRIEIGDRMTSSWFSVVVTSRFSAIWGIFNGSQCVAFPQGIPKEGPPPHCTTSCFDCIHSTMFPDSRRYGYFQKWSRPVYHQPFTHSPIHPFT